MTIFRSKSSLLEKLGLAMRSQLRALAIAGLASWVIGPTFSTSAPENRPPVAACSAEALAAALDDAGKALAKERPADAAVSLRGALGACPPNPAIPTAFHARLRVAALAALASHRSGDDAACRAITRNDKGLRYLYGVTEAEEMDEATVAALESAPKDAVSMLFQAVALCPSEQLACAEPSWSNTRQHAGELLKREDLDGALAIFFEAFAHCTADPLDDRAYSRYAWAISDAAFTAARMGNADACRALLRRDPGLRHVLGEAAAEDAQDETAAEFVLGANALSEKLKKALRLNAKQCR